MPNYYSYNPNPTSGYPNITYPGYWNQTATPTMQSYSQAPQTAVRPMEWVEGEIGAKAFQMPAGWPANQPIPLWDSTDTNIYLKSWSPMGIPNPLQKLHYTMPEQQMQMAFPVVSEGMSGRAEPDTSQYATKSDLEELKQELRRMNQNGTRSSRNDNQQNSNGGGNR